MKTKKTRVRLAFSEKASEEMAAIGKRLDIDNNVDIIQKALSLLNFVSKEQEEGSRLIIENARYNYKQEIIEI